MHYGYIYADYILSSGSTYTHLSEPFMSGPVVDPIFELPKARRSVALKTIKEGQPTMGRIQTQESPLEQIDPRELTTSERTMYGSSSGFVSFKKVSRSYPDTGESGETYDVEAFSREGSGHL